TRSRLARIRFPESFYRLVCLKAPGVSLQGNAREHSCRCLLQTVCSSLRRLSCCLSSPESTRYAFTIAKNFARTDARTPPVLGPQLDPMCRGIRRHPARSEQFARDK